MAGRQRLEQAEQAMTKQPMSGQESDQTAGVEQSDHTAGVESYHEAADEWSGK